MLCTLACFNYLVLPEPLFPMNLICLADTSSASLPPCLRKGRKAEIPICQRGVCTELPSQLPAHTASVRIRNKVQESWFLVLSHQPRSPELALLAYQGFCGQLQRQRTDCPQMGSSITQLLSLRDSSFPPYLLEKLLK